MTPFCEAPLENAPVFQERGVVLVDVPFER